MREGEVGRWEGEGGRSREVGGRGEGEMKGEIIKNSKGISGLGLPLNSCHETRLVED